jgi:hypothetical protein
VGTATVNFILQIRNTESERDCSTSHSYYVMKLGFKSSFALTPVFPLASRKEATLSLADHEVAPGIGCKSIGMSRRKEDYPLLFHFSASIK